MLTNNDTAVKEVRLSLPGRCATTVISNCFPPIAGQIISHAPISSLARHTSFLISSEWRQQTRHGGGLHVGLSSIAPSFQSSLHVIPILGGAYGNDGLQGQSGDNEEARERNWLESIVRMHELTWKRDIALERQNKDARKVFGRDCHDWEEVENEEKKKKKEKEGQRSATMYNKEDDGNMLSLLLPELCAQFSGIRNKTPVVLPGKRRKKSNDDKNAKMALFARGFGGPNWRGEYKHCSELVYRSRLACSFKVVTSVLGHHGTLPKRDYLILIAVAGWGCGSKRSYSTNKLLRFTQAHCLWHNNTWIFLSIVACKALFGTHKELMETGMATAAVVD